MTVMLWLLVTREPKLPVAPTMAIVLMWVSGVIFAREFGYEELESWGSQNPRYQREFVLLKIH